jgi:hypothetical protein
MHVASMQVVHGITNKKGLLFRCENRKPGPAYNFTNLNN